MRERTQHLFELQAETEAMSHLQETIAQYKEFGAGKSHHKNGISLHQQKIRL
jgi:hypothetical protein